MKTNVKMTDSSVCERRVKEALADVQEHCRINMFSYDDILEAAKRAETRRRDTLLAKSKSAGMRVVEVQAESLREQTVGSLAELTYRNRAWYLTKLRRVSLSRIYSRAWIECSKDQQHAMLKRYASMIGCSDRLKGYVRRGVLAEETADMTRRLPLLWKRDLRLFNN